jgi:hypothetical protein
VHIGPVRAGWGVLARGYQPCPLQSLPPSGCDCGTLPLGGKEGEGGQGAGALCITAPRYMDCAQFEMDGWGGVQGGGQEPVRSAVGMGRFDLPPWQETNQAMPPPLPNPSSVNPLSIHQAVDIVNGIRSFNLPDVFFCPLTPAGLVECIACIKRVVHLANEGVEGVRARTVRVVVCGGDGSVGWVVNELAAAGMGAAVAVGIIPVGTGNDLSITMGWGAYSFAGLLGTWHLVCLPPPPLPLALSLALSLPPPPPPPPPPLLPRSRGSGSMHSPISPTWPSCSDLCLSCVVWTRL